MGVAGGKQIERCSIASFQVAESMGFKGEFRQWEDLLRVGELRLRPAVRARSFVDGRQPVQTA